MPGTVLSILHAFSYLILPKSYEMAPRCILGVVQGAAGVVPKSYHLSLLFSIVPSQTAYSLRNQQPNGKESADFINVWESSQRKTLMKQKCRTQLCLRLRRNTPSVDSPSLQLDEKLEQSTDCDHLPKGIPRLEKRVMKSNFKMLFFPVTLSGYDQLDKQSLLLRKAPVRSDNEL